jgi:hypothetical protein
VSDPRIPYGTSRKAQWSKWADDKLRRRDRIVQVTGYKGGNGTQGKLLVPAASGRRGAGAAVATFKLRLTEDDYLVVREWDGTKEWSELTTAEQNEYSSESDYNTQHPYKGLGETDVYVLKPEDLRCGPWRKAWSEMSTTEQTNSGYANEAAYISGVGISYQSWGLSGSTPAFINYYKMFSPDRSEPIMLYGTTVSGSHNKWREESSLYNAGSDLYRRRLSVIRHVYATGGVIERQRVIPVWLKGMVIHAAELENPVTIPAKDAVAAVAEDGTVTGEDEIPARAAIPERTVTHLAVGLTSRWARV